MLEDESRIVSERKQEAEDQLRQIFRSIASEVGPEEFQKIAHSVALGLADAIRQELATGKITEVNPGYQALLAAERAERRARTPDPG